MSKLAVLDELLEQYYQLKYHNNPILFQRLQEVQLWKKIRMQETHVKLFTDKKNVLMADYFMNRLYGGPDFDALAEQIARLTKYAAKAEGFIPDNAVKTGVLGISLAILAVQLDEDVAVQLIQDYHPNEAITDEMMRQTYLKLEQGESRQKQLKMLDELGIYLDKYLRSFMIQAAFKMCKNVAIKHHFEVMYEFMQEGFLAIKPLKSAEKFIYDFTARERQIIDKVHSGHLDPFH
jgi:hypothetical protein